MRVTAFLWLMLLGTAAFAQGPVQLVPADAALVVGLNASSLDKKMSMADVLALDFFKALDEQMVNSMQDRYDLLSNLYKSPSKLGIDLFPQTYFYLQRPDTATMMMGLVFNLTDRALFEDFLSQTVVANSKEGKIVEGKGYRYLTSTQRNMAMGFSWTDKAATLLIATGNDSQVYEGLDFDDPNYYDVLEQRQQALAMVRQGMVAVALARVTAAKDHVGTNPNFMAFAKSDFDLGIWMGADGLSSFSESLGGASGMDALKQLQQAQVDMYKDSYYHWLLRFDQGSWNLSMRNYLNERLMADFGKLYSRRINPELLQYLNGEDAMAYGLFALDIKETFAMAIKNYLPIMGQMPEFGQQVEPAMDLLGIALDEDALAGLLKGDMLVAFTGVKEVTSTYIDYEYDENYNMQQVEKTRTDARPIMTAAATIGNLDDFMKIVQALEAFGLAQKEGDRYKLILPDASYAPDFAIRGNVLLISNDDALLSGKGLKKKALLQAARQAELLAHSQYLFMDFQKMMARLMESDGGSSSDRASVNVMQRYLRDFKLSGVEVQPGYFGYNARLSFQDGQRNGAFQLFQLINDIMQSRQ